MIARPAISNGTEYFWSAHAGVLDREASLPVPMTTHCTHLTVPPTAPVAPMASRPARASEGLRGYAVIAALGAAFTGFVTHGRGDAPLVVVMMVALVFFGALVLQFLLHVVFHLCMQLVRLTAPMALLLLIGHLCHWQWADGALHWLRVAGGHAVEVAGQAHAAWQGRGTAG